ncbi:MAG TPA: TonB-dependent receptor [Caulobacteraceae bacterium]
MATIRERLLTSTIICGAAALGLVAAPAVAQTQNPTQQQLQQPAQPGQAAAPVTDSENQDDGTRPEEQADQAAEEEAGTEEDPAAVEGVVVTGSRIRRNEFTSAAPITVITNEQAELEGIASAAEMLQESSVTGGAFQVNNQLTGFVATGGPGVNTISLRGLGAQRTLVIVNGKRAGPAGVRGQVGPFDLNVIPSTAVERTEILKDGASSIYGSDAVAGVVNFITRTNLDGLEVAAFAAIPTESGGEQTRFSASWGRTFNRGFFNISGEIFRQGELLRNQREDTACAADYLFFQNETQDGPGARADYIDPETGQYKCYGLFSNVIRFSNAAGGAIGDFRYAEPGETPPGSPAQGFTNPFPGTGLIRQGRNGYPETIRTGNYQEPLYGRATVISPSTRSTIYSTMGFDITPGIELFGEVLLNRRTSEQLGVRQYFPAISRENPGQRFPNGLPVPAVTTATPGGGVAPPVGSTAVGATFLALIPETFDFQQEVDYGRVVAGLRGALPATLPVVGGWDWELYTQLSRSQGTYGGEFIYQDRSNAVGETGGLTPVQFATAPQRFAACTTTPQTTNLLYPGNVSGFNCSTVPNGINFLDPRVLRGDLNEAERSFLFGYEEGETRYDHRYVEGFISGDAFQLPAGPIGLALGFQLRKEEIEDVPGQQAQLNNYWGSTTAGITKGSDSVRELFGETEIPLLRDMPMFQSVTLQLSGRYSDYESYGDNTTYKAGLNWQLSPAFRIRATQGTSFRAPSLYEQFLNNQTAFAGQAIDPCILYEQDPNPIIQQNCAAAGIPQGYTGAGASSALVFTAGGKDNLNPETSTARSLGLIWTPTFVDLNVALDYFDIEVEDQIQTFGSANILEKCYSSPTFPNDPFCTLFTRATGNPPQILTVSNEYRNVAGQSNRGIDLTFRYRREFPFGDFTWDGNFTWIIEDITQLLTTGQADDYLGTTFGYRGPDFVGGTNFRLDRGDWTFAWGVDFSGKGSDTEYFGGDQFVTARYADLPAGRNSASCATDPAINYCVYYKQFIEFTTIHRASVRWQRDDWTLQAGVRNVFDERAPSQSTGQFRIGTAAITNYNDLLLGRSVFFNIGRRF